MSFQLSKKERDALMQQVYGGFQKNPTYTKAAGVRGNDSEYDHADAGGIDYYAYGGDKRDIKDSYDFYEAGFGEKYGHYGKDHPVEGYTYGDRWRNKDTWKKVAGHLGIDRVDSKEELTQMYDFVQGIGKEQKDDDKPEYKPTPLPEDPYGRGDDDRLIGRPGGGRPGFGGGTKGNVPGSIKYKPPSDNSELGRAISSVADYGNRGTDDYFGRFLPEMGQRNVNEAKATGRSLLSNIQKFQGKVPELGDPKDLFEFYLGKIKD